MRYILFIFIAIFAVVPTSVFAICSETGATVVFVNGVLNSENDAKKSIDEFRKAFEEKFGTTNIKFILGYNPSHLAGIGDTVQSAAQMLNGSISDYDLNTILMKIQPEVTTRKILLVGHSQGTFYTNALYHYLITHGVPKESIAVYNVATPANEVAAKGEHLTSSNDSLIRSVTALAQKLQIALPLSANIDIPIYPNDVQSAYPGHNFIYAYLAGASDKIVSDVSRALTTLIAQTSAETCFTAPQPTIGYQAAGIALAAGDLTADTIRYAVVSPVKMAQTIGTYIGTATVAVAGTIKNTGSALWSFVSNIPASFLSAQLSGLIGTNAQPQAQQPSSLALQQIIAPSIVTQPQPEVAIIANPIAYEAPIVPAIETINAQSGAQDVPTNQPMIPLAEAIEIPMVVSEAIADILPLPVPEYHGSGSVTGVSPDAVAAVPPAEELPLSFSATSTTTDATATSTDSTATSTDEVIATSTSTEPVIIAEPEIIDGPPIVINEIAWMGTKAQANDEWIELYNKTNSDIDLSGWTLESKNKQPNIMLAGVIPARGYFLLERTASTTTDQLENMVYTGALNNAGPDANLYLKNGTTTIDFIAYGSNWFAGDNNEKRTMERVSPYATSTLSFNWKTYSETFAPPFAKDAKDGDILGTPGAKNSVTGYYTPAGNIAEDEVWRKAYSPYYVPYMISVSNNATLTIEPGVVVKFAKGMPYGGGMDVHGAVRAEGTALEPIIFTSSVDDGADGIDTNQDGSATSPASADWMNINFYGTSTPSVLSHMQVRYGGQGMNNSYYWYPKYTGVFSIHGARPQITDSVFEKNHAISIYTDNGAHPQLLRTTIKNTVVPTHAGAWPGGFGVRIADASSTADIIGNTFENNNVGISSESATSTPLIVKDNTFARNQKNGEFNYNLGEFNLENENNQDSERKGGFYIKIIVRDGQVKTLRADSMPYILRGGITVMEGGVLVIEPGAVIKSAPNPQAPPVPVVVRGTLKAQGTPDKPIVFTALEDDSDGYDSDGGGRVLQSGAWENIQFIGATSSDSVLEYVAIRYGGNGPYTEYKGAVRIQDAGPTISHATFDRNLAIAVYVEGDAQPTIAYSDFRNTKQAVKASSAIIGGIGISIGVESLPVLTDNTFTNNNEDVVYRP